MEDCQPCPFGTSSKAGAESSFDCVPVAQKCPPGQIAAPGAESREQCGCLPGYGGTYVRRALLLPCRAVLSPELLSPWLTTTVHAAPPEDQTRCRRSTPLSRSTKLGAQASCGSRPCHCSHQHATMTLPVRRRCCCCCWYAGGETPHSACHICPAGSWSPGGTTQPCIPCGFGYSSTEGATAGAACIPVNSCPAGTDYRQHDPEKAFTQADCVCKPGYGSPTGSGICRLCPAGTFSEGGSMEDCRPCAFGMTSSDGAGRCTRAVEQACPIGQWAPADAMSRDECRWVSYCHDSVRLVWGVDRHIAWAATGGFCCASLRVS
jgi:hypothetical protein